MNTLKKNDLQELVGKDGKWHVSIYMPAHRAGRDQQQNPIRLKNLMEEAEKKLLEYGVRKPDIEEMFGPVEELLNDRDFWHHHVENEPAAQHRFQTGTLHRSPLFEQIVLRMHAFGDLVPAALQHHATCWREVNANISAVQLLFHD